MYFQVVWSVLREPTQRALEAMAMQGQTQGKAEFPPFVQRLLDRGALLNERETLLRLLDRAGIAITEDERARIEACTDPVLLDRWVDNVFGAKTAADVLG